MKDFFNYILFNFKGNDTRIIDTLIVIFIILITFIALRIVKKIFNRYILKQKNNNSALLSIYQIIKYFIWVIVIGLCLETIGIEITFLLTSIAALLVGVGLGIQQLFNDLTSGIIILIEQSLLIEDIIELDDGTFAKVISIGIRTSKIKTNDEIIFIVPNSKLVNNKIINWSHLNNKTRFSINIHLEYETDITKAEDIIIACALNHKSVNEFPYPQVQLAEFSEYALKVKLLFWTKNTFDILKISSDIRKDVLKSLQQEGVKIPIPKQDIYIQNKD